MTETTASEVDTSFRVFPLLTMVVGAVIVGLGLLILPGSALGGLHIAAIGLSLFLSGTVATTWAAVRFDLSPADQRRWTLAFAVVAGVLLVLFIVLNWATFEGGEFESGGSGNG
ncbi:hypothetical protein [Halalkalicoccus tibetensis]|uniref:Uncharacterized protein n=1 Tax=Halalkalicoccus tibetensis TaxID=175632 RepID=A0ABD5V117_9EURY